MSILTYGLGWFSFEVNEILGDHNVDKQMTDSKGDVRFQIPFTKK